MPHHREELLTKFSAQQLFALVMDIESYPDFLPWCEAARIVSEQENSTIADLVIRFKTLTERYRSQVTYEAGKQIDVKMIDGPFKYLHNHWKFEELGNGQTKVIFEIEFSFKSKMLDMLIGMVFDKAVEKLASAFIKRAEAIYGANSAEL